jgi:hypothetical protein
MPTGIEPRAKSCDAFPQGAESKTHMSEIVVAQLQRDLLKRGGWHYSDNTEFIAGREW